MNHILRIVSLSIVGLLLLCCGGCGVVWIPVIERCPGPVRAVQVRDDVTNTPIASAGMERLAVKPGADGVFAVEGRHYLAGWQWLFPLFSWASYGDFKYHGHGTILTAWAPGYSVASLRIPAGIASRDLATQSDSDARFELDPAGKLLVFLRPAGTGSRAK